jgi:uncharacterized membrane protein
VDPFILEWLNILVRWGHLIAGIAWIGTSFYFVALDFSLRKDGALAAGVMGEAWEVHGGGFYHVQKYLAAPQYLPEHLIWFKWEAYLTWVTGFLLLIVQYYVGAGSYLIDPAVLPLQGWQAVSLSLVGLVLGWVIYDVLCRAFAATRPRLLMALVFAQVALAAYAYTHLFSGRGAFIHIGMMIGTMMAANVFLVIIPNQRKITATLLQGGVPDPAFGVTGKQRSLHNTYLTLPALAMMISNHFATITNGPAAWLVALLIVVTGVAARHFLLRHEVGDPLSKIGWTLPVIAVALMAAIWLSQATLLSSEWWNFLIRWGHLVAGIAWIGTSFYFVALDFSLRKRAGLPAGVSGEAWEVHGGGFYHVQKYLVAPAQLPGHLIWFKWEAYLTWVTGFSLLVVQYYIFAGTYLIDPAKLDLTRWQAVVISLASLVAGWVIYDGLCRSPLVKKPVALGLSVFGLILIAAYGFALIYSGRGALIHVGAMIGTIMAANVFMVIIPNQRKITQSLLKGEMPDPRFGVTGKQRSLHNTYLTLPVLLVMTSNHFPLITENGHAWVLVGLVVIAGAALRHFLVRIEVGDPIGDIAWAIPLIGAGFMGVLLLTEPQQAVAYDGPPVTDAEVLAIAQSRCAACHGKVPSDPTVKAAPKGIELETIDNLKRYAERIAVQAVRSRAMPLGNKTGMTTEERAKLGAWIAAQ